ncbi:MAG: ATP-binding protein [Candidatus Cryosericum sp.]
MDRYAMQELQAWKQRKDRKPMIIRGARQVGKTWLMKEFGKTSFQNVAYVNFENNPRMQSVFDGGYDVARLVSALQIETGVKITPRDTLIIFDEVQEVPKALTSLKYFHESAPEYAIVAADSLLGVALHEGTSFPVGKAEFLDLYPLSFREFLDATGHSDLNDLIRQRDTALITSFRDTYADLLKQYYYVGGMPEAVTTYLETRDFGEVRRLQKNLLAFYEQDFSKHAPLEIVPRMRMVWNAVPTQLARENRKFIYGQVREGARAKDFELAIQWLEDCGLLTKVYRATKPDVPLNAYMDTRSFKLYVLDIGLLGAMSDLDIRILIEGSRIFEEFKGSLTEQYVLQQLVSDVGLSPFYYATENSTGEVDFLIQKGSTVIPIEVKAAENLKSKSLRAYSDKYKPSYAVRTSLSNFRKESWLVNLPLYAISLLGAIEDL